MSELDLVPVLAAVAAASLLAWSAGRSFIARTPAEDRRWRDRPAGLWRFGWGAIAPLATALGPWLPAGVRTALSRALRQAGLDGALDAAHVAAASVIAGMGGAVVTWIAWTVVQGGVFTGGAGPVDVDGAVGWRVIVAVLAGAVGCVLPLSALRERRAMRLREISRALPFYLDVITLSVESGANLTGALQHAVAKGPGGPLGAEIERVLRDVRAGRTRADALRAMAERLALPSVASWVSALVAAERHGSSLGPILRAQAEQRRMERFQAAEKLAMKAPVKMLFPLLVFIFPCTFVLLFFPVVVRLLQEGLLR
jgi:tight adherence protein C